MIAALNKLDKQVDDMSAKLPALPENFRELIVKFSPYIAVISIVFSLPLVLGVLGLSAVAAPFAALGGLHAFTGFSLSIIFVIGNVILTAMAIPGLFARKRIAWEYMLYSVILTAISSLISFELGSLVVGTAISLYVLYQVKSYYK